MEADLPLAGVRCGACGYCLHGLPSAGRCPECGTGYHADSFGYTRSPNYGELLLPAVPLALLYAFALILAGSAYPTLRWPFFLSFGLAIIWAKRIASRIALAAYLERLAATPIEQPPPSRASYYAIRWPLFFATELAFGLVVLFLLEVLLRAQFS